MGGDLMIGSKYKIPQYQNGHVYLTSHRICYVDNEEPRRNSIAIELSNIEKYDYYVSQTCVLDRVDILGWLSQVICEDYPVPEYITNVGLESEYIWHVSRSLHLFITRISGQESSKAGGDLGLLYMLFFE